MEEKMARKGLSFLSATSFIFLFSTVAITSAELAAGAAFKRAELWLQIDGAVAVPASEDLAIICQA